MDDYIDVYKIFGLEIIDFVIYGIVVVLVLYVFISFFVF